MEMVIKNACKKEAVYFCIVHAGGNHGDEKLLIDLEGLIAEYSQSKAFDNTS